MMSYASAVKKKRNKLTIYMYIGNRVSTMIYLQKADDL